MSAQTTALGDGNGPARRGLGEEATAPQPILRQIKNTENFFPLQINLQRKAAFLRAVTNRHNSASVTNPTVLWPRPSGLSLCRKAEENDGERKKTIPTSKG